MSDEYNLWCSQISIHITCLSKYKNPHILCQCENQCFIITCYVKFHLFFKPQDAMKKKGHIRKAFSNQIYKGYYCKLIYLSFIYAYMKRRRKR